MALFNLFLQFFTALLSLASLVLVYMAVDECRESAFVPIYYFIGLSLASTMILSLSQLAEGLYGSQFLLASQILQDLFLSYVVLFLFGSLWQSYEASICVPKFSFIDADDA
jgi:hypothetical protein